MQLLIFRFHFFLLLSHEFFSSEEVKTRKLNLVQKANFPFLTKNYVACRSKFLYWIRKDFNGNETCGGDTAYMQRLFLTLDAFTWASFLNDAMLRRGVWEYVTNSAKNSKIFQAHFFPWHHLRLNKAFLLK